MVENRFAWEGSKARQLSEHETRFKALLTFYRKLKLNAVLHVLTSSCLLH